jgi:ATP adenylyltransferase
MKHLWAPWRMSYIENTNSEDGCLFCTCLKMQDGEENLILKRSSLTFVILNRYPYVNGHMMVVPNKHVASLDELDPSEQAQLMHLASQSIRVLRKVYNAESFNLGANIGEPAGAGIAEHVHLHIVPRWPGDTNFMATTASTRVLPEALEVTYQRLRQAWDSLEDQ